MLNALTISCSTRGLCAHTGPLYLDGSVLLALIVVLSAFGAIRLRAFVYNRAEGQEGSCVKVLTWSWMVLVALGVLQTAIARSDYEQIQRQQGLDAQQRIEMQREQAQHLREIQRLQAQHRREIQLLQAQHRRLRKTFGTSLTKQRNRSLEA